MTTTVGFVVHHERAEAVSRAREAVAWLRERGDEGRILATDPGLPEGSVDVDDFVPGLDLVVSLGGDGTMLRAVDLVARRGVPVMGVNVGHLGFLTEVEPSALLDALARFGRGEYDVTTRMLLDVIVERVGDGGGREGPFTALNEAVIEKTPMGHTVRLGVDVDGDRFTTYAADGLIVATPTGSTAYSFSARGPIVAPNHRSILLTPVSPHMLFDRALILEPTSEVRIEVVDDRAATLSVDGRNLGLLHRSDAVTCRASEQSARIVTFRPRDFLVIVKSKFGLEDR